MNPLEQAELAVIVEIFRRYPDAFVWIGGSVLRLVNHSPRTSFDIDLAPLAGSPEVAGLEDAIGAALDIVNPVLGRSLRIAGEPETAPEGFVRIRIEEDSRPAFSVDITRIVGSVRRTTTVLVTGINGSAAVRMPAPSVFLYQKIRSLYSRRYPKPGDLFDIWFLLESGVDLDEPGRAALEDEFDASDTGEKLRPLRKSGWIQALERAGVGGLTPETAAAMVDRVETFLGSVVK